LKPEKINEDLILAMEIK